MRIVSRPRPGCHFERCARNPEAAMLDANTTCSNPSPGIPRAAATRGNDSRTSLRRGGSRAARLSRSLLLYANFRPAWRVRRTREGLSRRRRISAKRLVQPIRALRTNRFAEILHFVQDDGQELSIYRHAPQSEGSDRRRRTYRSSHGQISRAPPRIRSVAIAGAHLDGTPSALAIRSMLHEVAAAGMKYPHSDRNPSLGAYLTT